MSGEPNTPAENSVVSEVADEVATDGTKTEGTQDEVQSTEIETETDNENTEVDTESEAFKNALSAKVEEVVGNRVAREKAKTDAAEARATEAESKLPELEQSVQTLTKERDDAQSEISEKDRTILKLKLAIEENVSVELIEKLKGDSEEELREAIKSVSSTSRKNSADRIFNGKDRTSATGSRSTEIIESGRELFKNKTF